MSSSLLHQACVEYLARLTWMVCEIGGEWPFQRLFCRVPSKVFVLNSTKHPCVVLIYR